MNNKNIHHRILFLRHFSALLGSHDHHAIPACIFFFSLFCDFSDQLLA